MNRVFLRPNFLGNCARSYSIYELHSFRFKSSVMICPTIRPLCCDFMTVYTLSVWTVTTIQAATSIQTALIFMVLTINDIIIVNADSYFPPFWKKLFGMIIKPSWYIVLAISIFIQNRRIRDLLQHICDSNAACFAIESNFVISTLSFKIILELYILENKW